MRAIVCLFILGGLLVVVSGVFGEDALRNMSFFRGGAGIPTRSWSPWSF